MRHDAPKPTVLAAILAAFLKWGNASRPKEVRVHRTSGSARMARMNRPPFHLAIPVHDLAAAREFYGRILECPEGRSSDSWVDFDFHGHQLVVHLTPRADGGASSVDGKDVPIPHFGLVLDWDAWHHLTTRLGAASVDWVIEPYVRFAGEVGEQATAFLRDPSGNALEFKAFRDPAQLFAQDA